MHYSRFKQNSVFRFANAGFFFIDFRMITNHEISLLTDLLKLQQIIALKFFGFELMQIKALLSGNASALEHFVVQAQFLEKKANNLLDASRALKGIVAEVKDDKSIQ